MVCFGLISSSFFFFFWIEENQGKRESQGSESQMRVREEEEKKDLNNQIESYSAVAILNMYNVIDPMMWVVFEQKYVKLTTFSILQ